MTKVYRKGKLIEIDWIPPSNVIDSDEVKVEAYRRILQIAPEWRQRNMIARSVELLSIGKENWSQEQIDEHNSIELIWSTIKKIRERSNMIEVMDSIPEDFREDKYWL